MYRVLLITTKNPSKRFAKVNSRTFYKTFNTLSELVQYLYNAKKVYFSPCNIGLTNEELDIMARKLRAVYSKRGKV